MARVLEETVGVGGGERSERRRDDQPGGLAGRSLIRLLRQRAVAEPRVVAFRYRRGGIWHDVTWEEYLGSVRRIARRLAGSGVSRGSVVAVVAPATPEWVFSILALQAVGCRALLLYEGAAGDGVEEVVAGLGVRTAIVNGGDDESAAVGKRGLRFRHVIAMDRAGGSSSDAGPEAAPGIGDADAGGQGDGAEAAELRDDLDEAGVLFVTAGTSGRSKLVAHSGASLIAAARQMACGNVLDRPLGRGDELVVEWPSGHIGAMLCAVVLPLVCRVRAHLPEHDSGQAVREVHPTFCVTPAWEWERIIRSVRVAALSAGRIRGGAFARAERVRRGRRGDVRGSRGWCWGAALLAKVAYALVFRPLLRGLGLERTRCVLVAGLISLELVETGRTWGVPAHSAYGMTEAGLQVALRDAAGLTAISREAEVRCAADGAVAVRGPFVCAGYVVGADITPAAGRDGWFATGDVLVRAGEEAIITPAPPGGPAGGGAGLVAAEAELRTSPYVVAAAAMEVGKELGAIVNLDPRAIAGWANRRGLKYELASRDGADPAVCALLQAELSACNERLRRRGLRPITMLAYGADWLTAARELTPARTVRRAMVSLPDVWAVAGGGQQRRTGPGAEIGADGGEK